MDLYQSCHILNVTPSDNGDTIRRAYLLAVKKWHPDRFSDSGELRSKAEINIRLINAAYAKLKDHIKQTDSPSREKHIRNKRSSHGPLKKTSGQKETSLPEAKELFILSLLHFLFRPLAFLINEIRMARSSLPNQSAPCETVLRKKKRCRRKSFSSVLLEVQKNCGLKRSHRENLILHSHAYRLHTRRRRNTGGLTIDGISENRWIEPSAPVKKINDIPPI